MSVKIKKSKENVTGILKGYLDEKYLSIEDIDVLAEQIKNELNYTHGHITKEEYEDFNDGLEHLMLTQHYGPGGMVP